MQTSAKVVNISQKLIYNEVCGAVGLKQDELRNHRRGVRSERQCPICQVELASSGEFLAHIHSKHLNNLHKNIDLSFPNDIDFDVYKKRFIEVIRDNKLPIDLKTIEDMYKDTSSDVFQNPSATAEDNDEELEETEYKFEINAKNTYLDSGVTVTRNVISKIVADCKLSTYISRMFACSYIDHYASSDSDLGWGCGYRNLQMLLSSLLEESAYTEQLRGAWYPNKPSRNQMLSIGRLQNLIEQAWAAGFDTVGSKQLSGTLVNTRKWIGATEVVALLSFLKIRCLLVDFHTSTSADNAHPELFKWVLNYFQSSSQKEHVPALYLQHQGHSRTIVGVEDQQLGGVHLLVLDPTHGACKMKQYVENTDPKMLHLIRISQSKLKAPQYQIVAVVGTIVNDSDYEKSKVLQSVRIP